MADLPPTRSPLALVAHDEEWWSQSIESILAPHGYAVIKAYTGEQALERSRDTRLDLVILNEDFDDMSGTDVCRILRGEPRIPSAMPILITTAGRWSRQQRLEALKAGAWDFLSLPLDAEELVLRLRSYMKAKFDADRAREEGLVDEVTGLYNLRGLMRRARELGSEAYRHARPLACVAFAPRMTNGNGDRAASQQTIERLTGVLRSMGRVSDAIGRIREGEFAVIAPATGEQGAIQLAERFIRTVEIETAAEEGEPAFSLLAGYDAVGNFREAGIQPSALLAGATTALRRRQAESVGGAIGRYEGEREVLDT